MKSMNIVALVALVASVAHAAPQPIDMNKFRETTAKVQATIRGVSELIKKMPPVVAEVKQTVDQMRFLAANFNSTAANANKIMIINQMNTLIIQDLRSLTNFISDIGKLVIAPIQPGQAGKTEEVAQVMKQLIDMIADVNGMLQDVAAAVETFE